MRLYTLVAVNGVWAVYKLASSPSDVYTLAITSDVVVWWPLTHDFLQQWRLCVAPGCRIGTIAFHMSMAYERSLAVVSGRCRTPSMKAIQMELCYSLSKYIHTFQTGPTDAQTVTMLRIDSNWWFGLARLGENKIIKARKLCVALPYTEVAELATDDGHTRDATLQPGDFS